MGKPSSPISVLVVFVFVIVAVQMSSVTRVNGQAPSISPDCTATLTNLASCLTYLQNGSNLTTPEGDCCSGVTDLINNNPICVCQVLETNNTYGLSINRTKVLMLPSVCRVSTPISECAVIGIPGLGPSSHIPASSPGLSPSEVPSHAPRSPQPLPPGMASPSPSPSPTSDQTKPLVPSGKAPSTAAGAPTTTGSDNPNKACTMTFSFLTFACLAGFNFVILIY